MVFTFGGLHTGREHKGAFWAENILVIITQVYKLPEFIELYI